MLKSGAFSGALISEMAKFPGLPHIIFTCVEGLDVTLAEARV
jgi:hypothetical protein